MTLKEYEYYRTELGVLYCSDSLQLAGLLPDESIDCIVTSPPYYALRNYGVSGQIGLEKSYREYIDKLFTLFERLRSKLKDTGSLWVNLGDTYNSIGSTEALPKTLLGIPDRFKIAMIDNGWICRNDIIWYKPSCMPQSAKDRFTVDYERMFFFTKNVKYYFKQQFDPISDAYAKDSRWNNYTGDHSPVKTGYAQAGCETPTKLHDSVFTKDKPSGRNKRCVWSINTENFIDSHFAVFPESLIRIPIDATCPQCGTVLDPFMGSGTVANYCERNIIKWVGFELSKEYCKIIKKRISFEADQLKLSLT